jgi:hypothetical protein
MAEWRVRNELHHPSVCFTSVHIQSLKHKLIIFALPTAVLLLFSAHVHNYLLRVTTYLTHIMTE